MGLTGHILRQIFGFWVFQAQLLPLAISSSLTGANGAQRTVAVSYGSGGSS